MEKKNNICFDIIKKSILLTGVLLLLCGFIYPLLMTGLGRVFFPYQAGGSLIQVDGKIIGSELLGQDFKEDYFMKCRPSAISYNTYTQEEKKSGKYSGLSSGSTNFGPTSAKLITRVEGDMKKFLEKNPSIKREDIPADLMTASGSGLDPHISPKSAEIQLDSLVNETGLSMSKLQKIVKNNTKVKSFAIFGEKNVNVLGVNIEIAQCMKLL